MCISKVGVCGRQIHIHPLTCGVSVFWGPLHHELSSQVGLTIRQSMNISALLLSEALSSNKQLIRDGVMRAVLLHRR